MAVCVLSIIGCVNALRQVLGSLTRLCLAIRQACTRHLTVRDNNLALNPLNCSVCPQKSQVRCPNVSKTLKRRTSFSNRGASAHTHARTQVGGWSMGPCDACNPNGIGYASDRSSYAPKNINTHFTAKVCFVHTVQVQLPGTGWPAVQQSAVAAIWGNVS